MAPSLCSLPCGPNGVKLRVGCYPEAQILHWAEEKVKNTCWDPTPHSHVSLVVVAYLLDPDVILGVNERLCCGIGLGESYHASNILEVIVVFHFDLMLEQGREREKETYTYIH